MHEKTETLSFAAAQHLCNFEAEIFFSVAPKRVIDRIVRSDSLPFFRA